MFINVHTHFSTRQDAEVLEIESLAYGRQPAGQSDYFSVGLHPWYLDGFERYSWKKWLESFPQAIAIGEAGLDKRTATPWEIQMDAFHCCIEVSEGFQKPLIIHCVRAFDAVLQVKKQMKPRQPWIFHGFNRNAELASRLTSTGCFLSFGAALLNQSPHLMRAIREVPADQFLLETDDSATTDIRSVYAAAATAREISINQLVMQVGRNFQAIFGLSI